MQPVNNYFYYMASIRFDESPCNLIGQFEVPYRTKLKTLDFFKEMQIAVSI